MPGANAYAVGNAPSAPSFAAPLLNFSDIGDLATTFNQGQAQQFQRGQMQRTQRLQNAFAGGVPMLTTQDGQQVPDFASMLRVYAGAGADPGQISSMADSAVRQQQFLYDRNSAPLIGGQPPGQQPNNATQPPAATAPTDGSDAPSSGPRPASNHNAAGPANIRGPQQSSPPPQPALSSAGADGQGSDSLRSIMTEHFAGNDVSGLIPRFAAAFKINPDQPLNAQQAAAIRARVAQTAASMSPSTGQNGSTTASNPAGGISGAPGPTAGPVATPASAAPQAPTAGAAASGATGDPTADATAFLRSQGIAPNARSLSAVRMFGPQGAAQFIAGISNNPQAPAASLFDPAYVKANRNLFYGVDGQPISAAGLYMKLAPVQPMSGAAANGPQSPIAKLMAADPTLGGLVPSNYQGGAAQYLNDMYYRAAGPMSDNMRKLYEQRIDAIQQYVAKNGGLTNDQKQWLAGARPGESQIEYEARAAGAKKAAVAPYEIAADAVRQGGRPVSILPNQVVTTGAQVDPTLAGITGWASTKLGIPNAPPPPASAPATTAAPSAAGPAQAPAGQPPMPPPTPTAPAISPAPANSALTGQSAFTPRMIRNPDGSVTSSVTSGSEEIQKGAAANYEEAHSAYNGAQQTKQTLGLMEDSFRTLNQTGWSSTGAGAEARLDLAKSINSVWSVLGVKGQNLPFDPNTIASWEDLTKNTTRLGFNLARTMGAREAMQIVQGAIKANPSVENTPTGARMVLNAIRQGAERDSDFYEYATRYAQTHGGDLVGSDVAFNNANPPSLYARRAIVQAQRDIPQEAVDALRKNPKMAGDFDKHFGAAGLGKLFLGGSVQ